MPANLSSSGDFGGTRFELRQRIRELEIRQDWLKESVERAKKTAACDLESLRKAGKARKVRLEGELKRVNRELVAARARLAAL